MRALPLCALALVGCSFSLDPGGAAYRCDEGGACPPGYVCTAGRCALPSSDTDAAPPPSWWDPAWRSRRPLTVHNGAAAALASGFQVGWRVDVQADVGEDHLDSLRVVGYQASVDLWTELPRVIDAAAAGEEVVWFTLPAALDPEQSTDVWIYFDHESDPDAPWSGTDVFPLSGPLASVDAETWVSEGPLSDEGTDIRFDSGAEMRSREPWPVDRAVDVVARVSSEASRLWFGFQREMPDLEPDVPWLVWIRREAGDKMLVEYAGPDDTLETRWSGAMVAVGDDPHVFTVERFRDRVVYRLDHLIAGGDHDHPLDEEHSAPLYIRFSNTGAASFWVSGVRVRQAAYPPPELTLGAREDLPPP